MEIRESEDVLALYRALTRDSWFDVLHPLRDAYLELDDYEASEACQVLVVADLRPMVEERVHRFKPSGFAWVDDLCEPNERTTGFDQAFISRAMRLEIDRINGEMYTKTILPQLTAFVLAYKKGLRP